MKESAIQKAFIKYLESQPGNLIVFGNPLSSLPLDRSDPNTVRVIASAKACGWVPGQPDIYVDESCNGFNGFRCELKAESPFTVDGLRIKANPHFEQQARYLHKLNEKGYFACVAVGLDAAIRAWEDYRDLARSLHAEFERWKVFTLPNKYTGNPEQVKFYVYL